MNNRRAKKKMAKEGKSKSDEPVKVTFMTTLADISPKQAEQLEETVEEVAKYDLETFINPVTREESFKMLFQEVCFIFIHQFKVIFYLIIQLLIYQLTGRRSERKDKNIAHWIFWRANQLSWREIHTTGRV